MIPKILVVENNKDFRKTISEYLRLEGYAITEAQVILEAESALKKYHFNAALVDVRMKDDEDKFDWSGLVLARLIAGYKIPAIILTSHDDPNDVERAYSVAPGIDPPYAFISKNSSNYLEKVSEKLGEIVVPRKTFLGWLKRNAESLVEIVLNIFKKVSKP